MRGKYDPGLIAGTLMWLGFALFVLLLSTFWARADWKKVAQEWEPYRLNESQKQWFKSIKAPNGVPCCDISDGHPTEMQRRADGIYIPDPIHLETPRPWIKVPDSAIVKGAINPIGVATVWWVTQFPEGIHVRCFVPEAET